MPIILSLLIYVTVDDIDATLVCKWLKAWPTVGRPLHNVSSQAETQDRMFHGSFQMPNPYVMQWVSNWLQGRLLNWD